jgi:hypothetical protein
MTNVASTRVGSHARTPSIRATAPHGAERNQQAVSNGLWAGAITTGVTAALVLPTAFRAGRPTASLLGDTIGIGLGLGAILGAVVGTVTYAISAQQ